MKISVVMLFHSWSFMSIKFFIVPWIGCSESIYIFDGSIMYLESRQNMFCMKLHHRLMKFFIGLMNSLKINSSEKSKLIALLWLFSSIQRSVLTCIHICNLHSAVFLTPGMLSCNYAKSWKEIGLYSRIQNTENNNNNKKKKGLAQIIACNKLSTT